MDHFLRGLVLCGLCIVVSCQSSSLSEMLRSCYNQTSVQLNLTANTSHLAVDSDIVYYEPFIQLIYGSYLQWDLERSLMDDSLLDDITGEVFGEYSFDYLVLPFFQEHCSRVFPVYKTCIVEQSAGSLSIFEIGIFADRVEAISERYCDTSTNTVNEEVMTDLQLAYHKIGGLYDLFWSSSMDKLDFSTLEHNCGSLNQTYTELMNKLSASSEENILGQISNIEGYLLDGASCYIRSLTSVNSVEAELIDLLADLTALVMAVDRQDLSLPVATTEHTAISPTTRLVEHTTSTTGGEETENTNTSKTQRVTSNSLLLTFGLLLFSVWTPE